MRIETPNPETVPGAPTYIYLEREDEHVVVIAQYYAMQLVAIPSSNPAYDKEKQGWAGFHVATRPRYLDAPITVSE